MLPDNWCLVEWLHLRLKADSVRELLKWVKRGGAPRGCGEGRTGMGRGEQRPRKASGVVLASQENTQILLYPVMF